MPVPEDIPCTSFHPHGGDDDDLPTHVRLRILHPAARAAAERENRDGVGRGGISTPHPHVRIICPPRGHRRTCTCMVAMHR